MELKSIVLLCLVQRKMFQQHPLAVIIKTVQYRVHICEIYKIYTEKCTHITKHHFIKTHVTVTCFNP